MISYEDVKQAINVDVPLSYIAETLRKNLIVLGILKKYKWKKKIAHQQNIVFDSLKNSLISNEASVVFVKIPSTEAIVISEEQLDALTAEWLNLDPSKDVIIPGEKDDPQCRN